MGPTARRRVDRLLKLVAHDILDLHRLAKGVGPAVIGAEVRADDDDGPAQLLFLGDAGSSLRVAEKVGKGVRLLADDNLAIGGDAPLHHFGDELVLVALAFAGAGLRFHVESILRRDQHQATYAGSGADTVESVDALTRVVIEERDFGAKTENAVKDGPERVRGA